MHINQLQEQTKLNLALESLKVFKTQMKVMIESIRHQKFKMKIKLFKIYLFHIFGLFIVRRLVDSAE